MKTLQEIFDQVALHLIKQGKQARGQYGCRYLEEDGSKCAVGCLLTEYDELIEGRDMTRPSDLLLFLLKKSGIDVCDAGTIDLLIDLQQAHDGARAGTFAGTITYKLKNIAKIHCLSTDELDKAVESAGT